jgi:hypothetical protein
MVLDRGELTPEMVAAYARRSQEALANPAARLTVQPDEFWKGRTALGVQGTQPTYQFDDLIRAVKGEGPVPVGAAGRQGSGTLTATGGPVTRPTLEATLPPRAAVLGNPSTDAKIQAEIDSLLKRMEAADANVQTPATNSWNIAAARAQAESDMLAAEAAELTRKGQMALEASGRSRLATNASRESAASLEAINRVNAMKAKGQQFAVRRGGQIRPLIGVEAADYVPRFGEEFGVMTNGVFQKLQ